MRRSDRVGSARRPDHEGRVERDGVGLAFQVFGTGTVTVVLLPTWQLFTSRVWKAQIAYLARHYRVVTFDARGSGASDRPAGPGAYTDDECAADVLAVMDATGTGRAVLVSLSCGASWALLVAARQPARVLGLFVLAPSCGLGLPDPPERAAFPWDEHLDTTEGWAKYNRHVWLHGDVRDFHAFFVRKMFTEPHSTKQIEDGLEWAADSSPQVLADSVAARLDGGCEPLEAVARRVRCPVTVVHGTEDAVRPLAYGERLAELTGGSLVRVEGGGHVPPAREPVLVNRLLRDFVDGVHPPARRTTWTRARGREKRALFLSSPIGLGHTLRDVAVAAELRRRHPDLRIDWLAQHPTTRVLAARGERVHPASNWLAREADAVDAEAGEHDLHAFQAVRGLDEVLVTNFMVFHDVVADGGYDLVVADEAWEVDHFLHENPELKRFSFAWLTDFVGWLPMPGGGPAEARLTADHNEEMIEQRARFARVRDRSVFVGEPEDVVPESFGPGLPGIREWTRANFDFPGYVTGFDPAALPPREELRERFGYREDERVCLVTVGGSAAGAPMLRRVLAAVPAVRDALPGLRFELVTGPRIDPGSLSAPPGTTVLGHRDDLQLRMAASDVAVVQGGLTTCMELTALERPFLYVPLRNHFEQTFHVPHRLRRYGAGRRTSYEELTDADALTAALAGELTRTTSPRPVATDGAARVADLLAELI